MKIKKIFVILALLVLGIAGVILYVRRNVLFKSSWSLMSCNSLHSNKAGCKQVMYILEGYKNKDECTEKGLAIRGNIKRFECGKNCRTASALDEIWQDSKGKIGLAINIRSGGRLGNRNTVCDMICNQAGCK